MVLMAYSECKIVNVHILNKLPQKCYQTQILRNFGQYVWLITIHWTDQTDTMTQQM